MRWLRANRAIRMAGAMAVVLALAATACGKDYGSAGGGGSTTSGGGLATTGGGSANATVNAENVSSLGMVLVDSRGFTLYHLAGETPSDIMCTGSCAQTWPPLKAPGSPAAGSGATGKLGAVKRPDGITQVTYDGLVLYTYSGDSGPGQSNGQGVQGVWFAVTPAGQSAKSGSGGGASTTGGGYYR